MLVNKVSFGASYEQTPNGNYYKKKNLGKRIGTMVGLTAGICTAATPEAQLLALSLASRIFPKNPGKMILSQAGIIIAGITGITMAVRALGGIPDSIINHKRIKKADHIA